MSARVPTNSPNAGMSQLVEDMQRLCEDQESADVVFLVGREEDRIYAHRLILMAR